MAKNGKSFESDKSLIRAVLSGKKAGFDQFFHDYFDLVFRAAMPLVAHDHHAAEDIAQMTLSKALARLDGFRGDAKLSTWLCNIARNQAIDWIRKNGKHNEHAISIDSPNTSGAVNSLPSTNQSSASEDVAIDVHRVLDTLPDRYGRILEMKYIYGLSAKEIADKLELGVEAANSLLARAKRAFRGAIADDVPVSSTSTGKE